MERFLKKNEAMHFCTARGMDVLIYAEGEEDDSSAALYMTREGTGKVKEISMFELMDRRSSVMFWRMKGTKRFFQVPLFREF
ncbi:hypothetical protein [Brazilian marseillevirus]|uniref:hypothetical protein n=1 Tax=Brazilian marseillevirus TaxID=1813599 RepID=UPI000782EDD6|nr:hypothetical protein A3303_gp213 [Brazilian marseillevirus]AMQ10721.1 hypothetical protein [Brazilian marseillevirus]